MNILFLIGNGFDLNVGLNTRYKDALNFYLNEKSEDVRIKKFKEDINKNFENWADFEKQLGVYTKEFDANNIDDFYFCVKHFKESLIKHLKNEEERVVFEYHKDKIVQTFYKNLLKIIKDFKTSEDVSFDFITFNYTHIFDRCIDLVKKHINTNYFIQSQKNRFLRKIQIGEIPHIHGDTLKNPLIGVDNVEQIKNKEFANTDKMNNLIIKTAINKKLNNNENAIKLIKNSDVICLFGLSLGETDKTWWKLIGKRLLESNVQLVIFNINEWNPIHNDEEIESIENVINKFYDIADIKEARHILENKIHVALNTDLFKVDLITVDFKKPHNR